MEFTVTLEVETGVALTGEMIELVAAIGGAASARRGGHRISTTLTVEAPSADQAGVDATKRVTRIVAGHATELEVLAVEEFDRRNSMVGADTL